MKIHSKNDTQTIKDDSTSIDTKTTKLSVEYWNWKAGNCNPKVTWAVKNQFSAYKPQSKRCSLCLKEKFEILEDKENNLLNKKSEVISKYRHQNKYTVFSWIEAAFFFFFFFSEKNCGLHSKAAYIQGRLLLYILFELFVIYR